MESTRRSTMDLSGFACGVSRAAARDARDVAPDYAVDKCSLAAVANVQAGPTCLVKTQYEVARQCTIDEVRVASCEVADPTGSARTRVSGENAINQRRTTVISVVNPTGSAPS